MSSQDHQKQKRLRQFTKKTKGQLKGLLDSISRKERKEINIEAELIYEVLFLFTLRVPIVIGIAHLPYS